MQKVGNRWSKRKIESLSLPVPPAQVGQTTRKERNAFTKLMVGKTLVQSTVRPGTCEPQWNENFQFLVEDPDNEELKIEVLLGE